MAAISQKASAEEVLPFLARNVVMIGYRRGKPTEFLLLLQSYLGQARELHSLAGPEGVIRVSNCREAQPLLAVLGYRLKQDCGPRTSVETRIRREPSSPSIPAFPLQISRKHFAAGTFCLSLFLHGPGALYAKRLDHEREPLRQQRPSGGSGVDRRSAGRSGLGSSLLGPVAHGSGTRRSLRLSPGLPGLLPFAPILDFYGRHISIRSGRVLVPGGTPAEPAWEGSGWGQSGLCRTVRIALT